MSEKVGRYVGARLILATVNATLTGIVFAIIGLPSWLALALWTGIVAQFIPAIGTYIAIALPALVGALSHNPWLGLMALGWGILYQQVENITIEPRISAKAVNVNPAVSFASVILGTAMFGVAGALLAIPVVAMLLALLDLYRKRYDLHVTAGDVAVEVMRAEQEEIAERAKADAEVTKSSGTAAI
jgi:predicted PurR-regulated permease PerM